MVRAKAKKKTGGKKKLRKSQSEISRLEDMYGDGCVRRLTEKVPLDVSVISSGIRQLDRATTVSGYPSGLIEIFGWESHGKTTIALKGLAEAQKHGECGFIDVEFSLVPSWAKKQGVDIDSLWMNMPETAEEAFDVAKSWIRMGLKMIVLDSSNALAFEKEIAGDEYTYQRAYKLGLEWKQLSKLAIQHGVVFIVISQVRMKINPGGPSGTVTGGGKSLPFYARIRIKVHRQAGTEKKTTDRYVSGEQTITVTVVKNKVGEPFQQGQTVISFDGSIRHSPEDYLQAAIEVGKVQMKSNRIFIVISTGQVLRGRKQFHEWLDDSPRLKRMLSKRLGG